MLPVMMISLALAGTTGFRGDGSGRFPDATLPAAPNHVLWRHETETWSNASPVRFGPHVCILEEPATLTCLDAQTGTLRWQATLDVLISLPIELAADLRPRLQALPALQQRRRDAARALGLARRNARAGGEGPTVAEATATLSSIQQELDVLSPYTTPPNKDIIGYTSPTPLVMGDRIYVLGGQGVFASINLDGDLQWSRWLGPPPQPMRGFDFGATASPVWASDLLIVGHGTLQALDPADGSTRWTAGPYLDYGTPAVIQIAGQQLVATPDGRLLHAATGQVLAKGLGDLWYTGPLVHDDALYYVGGHGNEREEGQLTAKGWRVHTTDDTVSLTPLFDQDLTLRSRLYGTPTWVDGKLWLLSRTRDLLVVDGLTGHVDHRSTLDAVDTEVWVGPVWTPGRLLLMTRGGGWLSAPPALPFAPTVHNLNAETRATPLPDGDRTYVRTLDALMCFGPPSP